jgi:hypothetical protein
MGCKIEKWQAATQTENGARLLEVIGEGECTQGGYSLRLESTNEGIRDDPEVVALRLIITPPEAGTDVITPARVEYQGKVDSTVRRVRVDTPDGSEWITVNES